MKKIDFKNLDKVYKELFISAEKAMNNSYSPYSNFSIGAALLTKNGEKFLGANIENASYGLTVCAERSAIFSAISQGQKNFKALAVISNGKVYSPCGACRQVLFEIYKAFGHDFKVFFTSKDKTQVFVYFVSELLPNAFKGSDLN